MSEVVHINMKQVIVWNDNCAILLCTEVWTREDKCIAAPYRTFTDVTEGL